MLTDLKIPLQADSAVNLQLSSVENATILQTPSCSAL